MSPSFSFWWDTLVVDLPELGVTSTLITVQHLELSAVFDADPSKERLQVTFWTVFGTARASEVLVFWTLLALTVLPERFSSVVVNASPADAVFVWERLIAGALGSALLAVENFAVRTGNALETVPEWFRRTCFCARATDVALV